MIEPARRTDLGGTSGGGGNGNAGELPVGASADAGRTRALPAAPSSGLGVQYNRSGDRRFVDATTGGPRRTFVAGGDGTTARPGSELASGQRRSGSSNLPGTPNTEEPRRAALPPGRANQTYTSPPTRLAVNERASARPTPNVPDSYTATRRIPPVQPASVTSFRSAGDSATGGSTSTGGGDRPTGGATPVTGAVGGSNSAAGPAATSLPNGGRTRAPRAPERSPQSPAADIPSRRRRRNAADDDHAGDR